MSLTPVELRDLINALRKTKPEYLSATTLTAVADAISDLCKRLGEMTVACQNSYNEGRSDGWASARGEWVPVKEGERKPPPSTRLLIFITGGPLHHGEDYFDFGIYVESEKCFKANVGTYDAVVNVSHWMPAPDYPRRLQ